VLSLEEAQLKLKDLRQAILYEQERHYIDVQGRKKSFSRFVCDTLNELGSRALKRNGSSAGRSGGIESPVQNSMDSLHQRFEQYAFMDLSARMNALDGLAEFITRFSSQMAGHRSRITTVAIEENTSATNTESETSTARPLLPHQRDVQFLKGVGPRLAGLLKQVGIHTNENLLYYFPRRYLDYNNRVKIKDLQAAQDITLIGAVQSVSAHNAKTRNLTIVTVVVADDTGRAQASWFYGKSSRAALESYKNRFVKGMDIMLSGKVKWDSYKRMFSLDRPQVEILSYQDAGAVQEADSLHVGRIVPIYALTEGLNLRFLRKAIHQALVDVLPSIVDPLPMIIQKKYQLVPLHDALQQIHFPDSRELAEKARQRLVFDELFFIQLRLALMKREYKRTVQGLSLKQKPEGYVEQFRQLLPFALTGAQERVFVDITADMASHEPMYRMLQGDVGSGKTVVALLTLLTAVENGYQGALMAPTEILAEQHYRKCVEWLTPLGLRVGLFVGKSGSKERRELRQALLNGQIHIAVGTHALIQEDVEFAALGVVVVDEQHRFGVRQRTLLKSKGQHPEMLTMTATPIPRSLAMTLHGDLDVSMLDELPPGRTPIKTVLLTHAQADRAYQLIKGEILKGRQAYVVFPLIEESETLSARAATTEAERLQQEVFPERSVGLLHGKMKPEEKDTIMSAFAAGRLDILVSTTVVEVGVDVPNATVMVIENADRFGLSQLHQLRGRVGRGAHASYCALVSDSRSDSSLERLGILTESEDGFYIAEKDLELRGPGEFLGTRQSGLPDFVLADLIQDRAILDQAREAATALAEDADSLNKYPELYDLIYEKTEQSASVLGAG
jgi:ATP-dependent DNA helicase RecG